MFYFGCPSVRWFAGGGTGPGAADAAEKELQEGGEGGEGEEEEGGGE